MPFCLNSLHISSFSSMIEKHHPLSNFVNTLRQTKFFSDNSAIYIILVLYPPGPAACEARPYLAAPLDNTSHHITDVIISGRCRLPLLGSNNTVAVKEYPYTRPHCQKGLRKSQGIPDLFIPVWRVL